MFGYQHSQTVHMLKMGLDGLERRQTLLANNIANINTPGYVARDLDFKTVMEGQARGASAEGENLELAETSEYHLVDDEAMSNVWDEAVVTSTDAPDIQTQMVGVNQTSMQYAAMAQLLSQQFARYRHAIQDGSR